MALAGGVCPCAAVAQRKSKQANVATEEGVRLVKGKLFRPAFFSHVWLTKDLSLRSDPFECVARTGLAKRFFGLPANTEVSVRDDRRVSKIRAVQVHHLLGLEIHAQLNGHRLGYKKQSRGPKSPGFLDRYRDDGASLVQKLILKKACPVLGLFFWQTEPPLILPKLLLSTFVSGSQICIRLSTLKNSILSSAPTRSLK